jgi:hypothetical protein
MESKVQIFPEFKKTYYVMVIDNKYQILANLKE